MQLRSVLIVGGAGFIGRHLAQRLASHGLRVIVTTRHARLADPLRMLPTVELVEADVYDTGVLCGLMNGIDAVVNLVGVLHSESDQPYGPEFARAHVELPRTIVAAARLSEVSRIVHVSSLGADPHGPSEYLRSKADGEAVIRAAGPDIAWSIFRPSVVYGPQDHFLSLLAQLTRLPVLPLGGAHTRFQPVFVDDVVTAVSLALETGQGHGDVMPLVGPRTYTLAELAAFVARLCGHHTLIVPLPEPVAMLQAAIMEWLPGPLMSRDNLRSMQRDSVLDIPGSAPLPFGLVPCMLESVAAHCLARETSVREAFNFYRQSAHRH